LHSRPIPLLASLAGNQSIRRQNDCIDGFYVAWIHRICGIGGPPVKCQLDHWPDPKEVREQAAAAALLSRPLIKIIASIL
jgi:hypothetical protein